jgi:RimJ/RimL family protein N-acetyltransferase
VNALAPRLLDTARMRGEPLGPQHEGELAGLAPPPRRQRTPWPWSRPAIRTEVRAGLADKRDHWERHGFGLWLLRDRDSGVAVGRGGLQFTDAIGGQDVEAAWAIVPERRRQGLGTELARASVWVAFAALGLHELIAITLPDNVASRRVMDNAGFVYERDVIHAGRCHNLYLHGPDTGIGIGIDTH